MAAPRTLQRGPPADALLPGQFWGWGRRRHAAVVRRVQGRVDAARAGAGQHYLRGGGEPGGSQDQGDECQPDGERDWRAGAGDVGMMRGDGGG